MIKFFRIISERSKDVTAAVFLHLSYGVGVGMTSIISKLIGKQFLDMSPTKSTWTVHPKDSAPTYMY